LDRIGLGGNIANAQDGVESIGLTGGSDISPIDQIMAILGRRGRGGPTRRAVPGQAGPAFGSERAGSTLSSFFGDDNDDDDLLELLGGF